MGEHRDVIVIGSGAGGGTIAHRLAPSGKRILILERGEPLPREKDDRDARAVQIDRRHDPREAWSDAHGSAFVPGVKYFIGGKTKVRGAATLRLRPSESGVVNPTLTILANALGVADRILERLQPAAVSTPRRRPCYPPDRASCESDPT
jgi:choline dehydrogenase-like flavoprotein